MLIECPECQKKIGDTLPNCPYCSYQLTADMIAEIKRQVPKASSSQKRQPGTYRLYGCLTTIGLFVIFSVINSYFLDDSGENRRPSPYYLENMIKTKMHNPDSYKELNVEYGYQGSNDIIKLTYQGTNAFGGTVKNSIVARVNGTGQVLEVIATDP